MVDYLAALKKPFTSFKRLTLGALLFMVPIAGLIVSFFDLPILVILLSGLIILLGFVTKFFAYGYALESALDKKQDLPPWLNWKKLFGKGFLAWLVALIYFIPVFIVIIIFGGVAFVTSLTNGDILSIVATASIGVLATFILGLLTLYVTPIAVLKFIQTNNFIDAFKLKFVFKKAFTGHWFLAWLIAVLFSLLIGAVGGFVSALLGFTLVGAFILLGYTQFIILITSLSILGQAYKEIKIK